MSETVIRTYLRPRQAAAIEALLTSLNLGQAAEKCNVTERTIRRWLVGDQLFKEKLRQAQQERIDNVARVHAGMAEMAVHVIYEAMTNERLHAGLRAQIASGWLDRLQKYHEQADIDERLAALEELTEARR